MFMEFHILQSFPLNCLNRDDLGQPKTVRIGGVTRARISSQCWKRQIRLTLPAFGVQCGIRSRQFAPLIADCIIRQSPGEPISAAAAQECADRIASLMGADNMCFLTFAELDLLASLAKDASWDPKKIEKKAIDKLSTRFAKSKGTHDALDVALFGRMIAKADQLNVEACASFAHSFTTHAISTDFDYFTAVDDLDPKGLSGHIGLNGFSAGVFYRYIVLDVTQLAHTLGLKDNPDVLVQAVEAFTKALYTALPQARQTTMSAHSPWSYAHVLIRDGWPLQAGFEKPVQAIAGSGLLGPSIKALEADLALQEKLSGSLYGKKTDFIMGEENPISIDELAKALGEEARKVC